MPINRRRVAYHEAGHAVLSAALNDLPSIVSIRADEDAQGRVRYRSEAGPTVMLQIHLAGFAAEELAMRARPRRMKSDIGWAILRTLAGSSTGVATSDEDLAVREVLRLQEDLEPETLHSVIETHYQQARDSLDAVWPGVQRVARALLRCTELDSDALVEALSGVDIYEPIFSVQRAWAVHSPPLVGSAQGTGPEQRNDCQPLIE